MWLARRFAEVLLVLATFASVAIVAAAYAPGAEAQGASCTKTAAAAGVELDVSGLVAGDRVAIRRNGKWAASPSPAELPWVGAGAADDVWTVRLRGQAFTEPYEELTCVAANAGGGEASCIAADAAGAVRLELDGFVAGDRLSVRRNGGWVATVDGSVPSVDNFIGDLNDAWTIRARGAAFEDPYTTVECEVGVVDPPPPNDSFCVESDGTLSWNDAGVDTYQVRRSGSWVATTPARSYATDGLTGEWLVRYRLGQSVVNEPCVPEGEGGDPVDPAVPTCSAIVDPGNRERVILTWDLGPTAEDPVVVRTGNPDGNSTWRAQLTGETTWSGPAFKGSINFLRVRIAGERTDVQCLFPDGPFTPDPLDTPLGTCTATADGPNRGDRVVLEWATADDVVVTGSTLRLGYEPTRTRYLTGVESAGTAIRALGEDHYVVRVNYLGASWDIPCEGIEDLVFVDSHPGLQLATLPVDAIEVSPGTYLFSETWDFLGQEVWFGDGTRDGSVLLGDFRRGADGDGSPVASNGSTHYFESGRRLYVTDGTPDGTRALAAGLMDNAIVMSDGSLVGDNPLDNGSLVIIAANGTVARVNVGADVFETRPRDFYDLGNGSVVFVADQTIFRTDLTEAGTVRIAPAVSGVEALVQYGDQYFFSGETDSAGRELWVTDGTAAGTRLVVDLVPGAASSDVSQITVGPNGFWFMADTAAGLGLWFSDGTAAGTVRLISTPVVNDIQPELSPAVGERLVYSVYNGRFFDLLSIGTTAGSDEDLFTSSDTARLGVTVVDDDRHIFLVFSPDGERTLWQTDGSAAGTEALFNPGFSLAPRMFNLGLYFYTLDDRGFIKQYYEFAD